MEGDFMGKMIFVNAGYELNVRLEPSTNADVIGKMESGGIFFENEQPIVVEGNDGYRFAEINGYYYNDFYYEKVYVATENTVTGQTFLVAKELLQHVYDSLREAGWDGVSDFSTVEGNFHYRNPSDDTLISQQGGLYGVNVKHLAAWFNSEGTPLGSRKLQEGDVVWFTWGLPPITGETDDGLMRIVAVSMPFDPTNTKYYYVVKQKGYEAWTGKPFYVLDPMYVVLGSSFSLNPQNITIATKMYD
jgi:hypothetical protein